jgi:hypothetical protein
VREDGNLVGGVGCGEYIGVVVAGGLVPAGERETSERRGGKQRIPVFFLSSFLFCFSFNR